MKRLARRSNWVSTLVVITLLAAIFIPVQSVFAATPPVLQSPKLTIGLTTPTFKWLKVTGATSYKFQVWLAGAGTPLINLSVPGSICGSTTCSYKPATVLGFNTYKWRAAAYIGGWQSFSPYTFFNVTRDFISQFNGSMTGWESLNGIGPWSPGTTGMFTYGSPGKFSSVKRITTNTYTNFDFQASVIRSNATTSNPQYIVVRAGNSYSSDGIWYPAYWFGYSNDAGGDYAIVRLNPEGTYTSLQPWTDTGFVSAGNYNTMRVIAVGGWFSFYINGSLVKTVYDSTYNSGWIGFTMFQDAISDYVMIDWATITTLRAAAPAPGTISPQQLAFNKAAWIHPDTDPAHMK